MILPPGELAGQSEWTTGGRKGTLWLDFGPDWERPHYIGTANGPWGPKDGRRFGFFGLGGDAFHFRTNVPGYEVEPAGPLRLEPGELRFVRVILRPAAVQ